MLNAIEREKRMADHLFYVSMKYSKTADVILNLINRWQLMIEKSIEYLLRKVKKAKKLKDIPETPKAKEILIRKFYKNALILEALDLNSLFRKLPNIERLNEYEFRKNIAIRATINGTEIKIDMDKLKEWNEKLTLLYNLIKKI